MRSIDVAEQKNRMRGRVVTTTALLSASLLALSACGAKEYPAEFTVQNGDSSVAVGEEYRYTDVTGMCSEKGGQITLTLTAEKSGNKFTTTQPEEGSGYAGGTLTMGDGKEYTFTPLEGITEEDVRGDAQIFENKEQDGTPPLWSEDGSVSIAAPMYQMTTDNEQGEVRVQSAGKILCQGD